MREVELSKIPRPVNPKPVPPAVHAIADIGRALARSHREQAREEDDTRPLERFSLLPDDRR